MKVWLDDVRPAPPDWFHCTCAQAAKMLLKTGKVVQLSIDHDLGVGQETGYSLVEWMISHKHWPKEKPVVHSSNAEYAVKIRGLINKHGPYDNQYSFFVKFK